MTLRRWAWLPIVAVAAGALALTMNPLARSMLYPAPPWKVPSPPPDPYEAVALPLPDGGAASAWLFDPGRAGADGKPALILFHGNGENLGTMHSWGLLADVRRFGSPFLAVDYPGYGLSDGKPSEAGLAAAGDAAVDLMRERFPERPLVVWGWSLGAAVAIRLAAKRPQEIAGLVALSPWTSLAEVAQVHFPDLLVRMLLTERYDSLAAAPRVRCPALIVHGARDRTIPVAHGRAIAAALPGADTALEIADAAHNDLLARPRVWRATADFLAEIEAGSLRRAASTRR